MAVVNGPQSSSTVVTGCSWWWISQ